MIKLLLMMAFVLISATASMAAGMADIFAAADITGLSTNVSTLLIGFIGVALLFTAARYVKRSLKG